VTVTARGVEITLEPTGGGRRHLLVRAMASF
jgi:hypothetical protein